MKPKVERTYTRVKYRLVIDFDDKWIEGMGLEGLTDHIKARIEACLGSHPSDRGNLVKLARPLSKTTRSQG